MPEYSTIIPHRTMFLFSYVRATQHHLCSTTACNQLTTRHKTNTFCGLSARRATQTGSLHSAIKIAGRLFISINAGTCITVPPLEKQYRLFGQRPQSGVERDRICSERHDSVQPLTTGLSGFHSSKTIMDSALPTFKALHN